MKEIRDMMNVWLSLDDKMGRKRDYQSKIAVLEKLKCVKLFVR